MSKTETFWIEVDVSQRRLQKLKDRADPLRKLILLGDDDDYSIKKKQCFRAS